jgi:chemotaxis protein CheC
MTLLLNDVQSDVLTEVVNIGVGRAAALLSEMIKERIGLSVPHVKICGLGELAAKMQESGEPLDTSIVQDFAGGVSGRALLCFPKSSGIKLGQVFAGDKATTDELDFGLTGILEEVGNIVLNSVLGTIGNLMGGSIPSGLEYSVPQLHTDSQVGRLVANHLQTQDEDDCSVLMADARFKVDAAQITGSLLIAFDLGSVETICRTLGSAVGEETSKDELPRVSLGA